MDSRRRQEAAEEAAAAERHREKDRCRTLVAVRRALLGREAYRKIAEEIHNRMLAVRSLAVRKAAAHIHLAVRSRPVAGTL